jgi:hypothetical protein
MTGATTAGGSREGRTAGGTAGALRGAGPAGIGGVARLLGRTGPGGTAGGGGGGSLPGGPSSGGPFPAATATRAIAAGDLYAFTTPSKNIGCMIDATSVRCDIRAHTWQVPPKPAGCDLDYGQGITLGADPAQYVCAGDTTFEPNATVLPYNEAVRAGNLLCVSTQAFLACRNLVTDHGFSLSKETPPPMY